MRDAGTFTIVRVLRRTVPIARRGLAGFGAVAVLFVLIPSLWGYLVTDAIEAAVIPDGPGRTATDAADMLGGLIDMLPDMVGVIGTTLLAGIVVEDAVAAARGRAAPFSQSLRRGLARFPTTLAIIAASAVVFAFGAALLLAPGLMILSAWSVAVPVGVAEEAGFVEALRRSRVLTSGHRWRICGLVTFGIVAFIALDPIENAVAAWLDLGDVATWIVAVVAASLQTVLAVLSSACCAATYLELRETKEGALSAAVLAAFD